MLFKKSHRTAGMKWRLIGIAGKLFIDFLFSLSRIDVQGRQAVRAIVESGQCIYAFWHARILLISYYHQNIGASILVSASADGEIIAQILKRQGQITIRGSTRKGGMRALTRQIADIKKRGCAGAVVPDGPQGPRHKVQPGVILLAQKTGLPIVPISYSAKRIKVFNSWDRFILPYPGTPCLFIYGEPIYVPADADNRHIKERMLALEHELNRISAYADRYFGHSFGQ